MSNEDRDGTRDQQIGLPQSGSTSNFQSSQELDRSTVSNTYATSAFTNWSEGTHQKSNPPPKISDLAVTPFWIEPQPQNRFLLLEDRETGDILFPATRLKEIFGDNYSRLLNSVDNRAVRKPYNAEFGSHSSHKDIFWWWPFECPAHVKTTIRHELNDFPSGHVRLILLPIVYNAMRKIKRESTSKRKPDHRVTTQFLALESQLEKALRVSNYAPFMHLPETNPSVLETQGSNDLRGAVVGAQQNFIFNGPLRLVDTANKYMTTIKEHSYKRARKDSDTQLKLEKEKENREVSDLRAEVVLCNQKLNSQATKIQKLEILLKETRLIVAKLGESMATSPPTNASALQTNHSPGPFFWDKTPAVDVTRGSISPRSSGNPKEIMPAEESGMFMQSKPAHIPAMRRQMSTGCISLPNIDMTRAQYYPPQYVANTDHHLTFPEPCTPHGAALVSRSPYQTDQSQTHPYTSLQLATHRSMPVLPSPLQQRTLQFPEINEQQPLDISQLI